MKPNEALSKAKPRLILSSGGVGCTTHILDTGAIEHLTFSDPLFEERSIKHETPEVLAARVCRRACDFDYVASMDFGSFDGSCTKEIRDIVENSVLVALLKEAHLLDESDGGVWLVKAPHERVEEECKIDSGFSKGVTMII